MRPKAFPRHGAELLRFGRFEIQPLERRLLADGKPVSIGSRALNLLIALAERPGRLVGRQVLLELAWPGQVVEENNLTVQIKALRTLLGDAAIATVPGCGYRFTANVVAQPSADPALPAGDPPVRLPTRLPQSLPGLLGREDDLAALAAMVDEHRLVSLTGAGGVGKSLLAQHLLNARRTEYPHGVCWIELGAVTEPAALPGAIAAALGIAPHGGDPLPQLARAVAPLQMLVALDNAEHLLGDVAELVAQWLDAAPGIRVLVTSQAPLRLPAERVYRLGSLAVPPGTLPAAQALAYGAIALFADRARAADSRFILGDADVPLAAELCRALDGLPLAIELAAARVPALGLRQLVASMHDRLALLTRGANRNAADRQQTLRATLEWSHQWLDADEQAVFRRMAVIKGTASLELVQQITLAAPGPTDRWVVLDALGALVERSLVAVIATDDREHPRYRLLETPRAFAREQLVEAGELESTRRRHASAMAALFHAAWDERLLGSVPLEPWQRRLAPDLVNAREAFDWALAAGEHATALAIAATLLRAIPRSGAVTRAALARACEPLIGPGIESSVQLAAWAALSGCWAQSQPARSAAAAESARAIARSLYGGVDDRPRLYATLALCAHAVAGMTASAAQAAMAEVDALEDPAWPPALLLQGAVARARIGQLTGAPGPHLTANRRAMELARACGHVDHGFLANLIDAELAAGDAQAAAHSGEALVEWLQHGRADFELAVARINLCAAWLALGNRPQARAVAQAGWPPARRYDILVRPWSDYLALLAALEERPGAAARLLGYSQARCPPDPQPRQPNEAAAFERARSQAVSALGDTELERLAAEGANLRDDDVARWAFGDGPAGAGR